MIMSRLMSVIFFTLGDWGGYKFEDITNMKKIAEQMNRMAKMRNPKFIITLGDNFYDYGVNSVFDRQWDESWYNIYIKPYPVMSKIRWHATLGNHDSCGGYQSIETQIQKSTISKNWYLPKENYYYCDEETNSYFIHIDTCKIYPELYYETKLMVSNFDAYNTVLFLENALVEAKENNAHWIFVFGHYHIFSNGFYDNYEKMERRILPLLLKYNVDVYFCGHEHNFQILKYKNLHMIVNGAATFNTFVEVENSNSSVETKYASSNNGFCYHKINENKFHTYYINNDGKTENNYTIEK